MSDRFNLFSGIGKSRIMGCCLAEPLFGSKAYNRAKIHRSFQKDALHFECSYCAWVERSQKTQLSIVEKAPRSMILKRNRAAVQTLEVGATLTGLQDWQDLIAGNPHFCDGRFLCDLAKHLVANGAIEPLTNILIPAGELQSTENLREGLIYSLVNSRMRAVMLCIQWLLTDKSWVDTKIYATEAVTPFALRLRGIFPKFIGSEYTENEAQRRDLYPILCEDLQQLSFPDNCFDIVTTNEVLEHVPSIDKALGEIHRVLKPGGWHVGTAPFAMGQVESISKARLEAGEVIYLAEPEYHGNPVDERGSLVFEIPGWDILHRARAAGFKDAHVKYILSSRHACLSSDAGGIFVFCFQK